MSDIDVGQQILFRRSDDPESVLSDPSEGVFIGMEDGEARVRRETEYNVRVHKVKPEWIEEEIEELSLDREDVLSKANPIKCKCGGNCMSRDGIMRCTSCGKRIRALSQGSKDRGLLV